jgi:DNA-binding transcriptional regulator YiaG
MPIPRHILNKDYPINPKTLGEKLRKERMDTGLLIKEFATLIGVAPYTVINWEVRGMRPWEE